MRPDSQRWPVSLRSANPTSRPNKRRAICCQAFERGGALCEQSPPSSRTCLFIPTQGLRHDNTNGTSELVRPAVIITYRGFLPARQSLNNFALSPRCPSYQLSSSCIGARSQGLSAHGPCAASTHVLGLTMNHIDSKASFAFCEIPTSYR